MSTDESRRQFLATAATMSVLPHIAAAASVNPDDPAHRMTTLMKMYGAIDDRVCFGFVQGTYYGVSNGNVTPLHGVLAAVFNRFVPRADGTYDGAIFEVAYFTDLATGERFETFRNPYTNETVEVPITRSGPHPIHMTPTGRARTAATERSDREITQVFRPFRVIHDDVWLVEEIVGCAKPGALGAAHSSSTSSITNYSAKLSDLLDPAQKTVRTHVHYHATVSWRPWLKMGDRPGYMMGNAAGRTVMSIDELPPKYVALTKKLHPDVLDDPMALLKSVKA